MLGAMQLTRSKDDDNVFPIRPQQSDLFGEPVANSTRINPKKAMLKFPVRRDYVDDIPLVRAKQLGLNAEIFEPELLKIEVTDGEALSERAILRIIEGDDSSGHLRAAFNTEVTECVEAFFHQAKMICGWDLAVCMLFSMISKSPSYLKVCPDWIIEVLFIEERELVFAVFHGLKDDRRTELGDSPDDDDEEESEEP